MCFNGQSGAVCCLSSHRAYTSVVILSAQANTELKHFTGILYLCSVANFITIFHMLHTSTASSCVAPVWLCFDGTVAGEFSAVRFQT